MPIKQCWGVEERSHEPGEKPQVNQGESRLSLNLCHFMVAIPEPTESWTVKWWMSGMCLWSLSVAHFTTSPWLWLAAVADGHTLMDQPGDGILKSHRNSQRNETPSCTGDDPKSSRLVPKSVAPKPHQTCSRGTFSATSSSP